jgi:hypothetical protein
MSATQQTEAGGQYIHDLKCHQKEVRCRTHAPQFNTYLYGHFRGVESLMFLISSAFKCLLLIIHNMSLSIATRPTKRETDVQQTLASNIVGI